TRAYTYRSMYSISWLQICCIRLKGHNTPSLGFRKGRFYKSPRRPFFQCALCCCSRRYRGQRKLRLYRNGLLISLQRLILDLEYFSRRQIEDVDGPSESNLCNCI